MFVILRFLANPQRVQKLQPEARGGADQGREKESHWGRDPSTGDADYRMQSILTHHIF